jgi:hypothetical protein
VTRTKTGAKAAHVPKPKSKAKSNRPKALTVIDNKRPHKQDASLKISFDGLKNKTKKKRQAVNSRAKLAASLGGELAAKGVALPSPARSAATTRILPNPANPKPTIPRKPRTKGLRKKRSSAPVPDGAVVARHITALAKLYKIYHLVSIGHRYMSDAESSNLMNAISAELSWLMHFTGSTEIEIEQKCGFDRRRTRDMAAMMAVMIKREVKAEAVSNRTGWAEE